MKPLGISLTLDPSGMPRMSVTPSDRVADMIWKAVQEAILANWTPEQFKREAADSWAHELREAAKDAAKVLST